MGHDKASVSDEVHSDTDIFPIKSLQARHQLFKWLLGKRMGIKSTLQLTDKPKHLIALDKRH